MENVKKDQAQEKEIAAAKGPEALSDAQLDQVAGGVKLSSDFNPQPEPPGRRLPG